MKVTWQVDDGYCGPSRPHTTEIDEEELGEFETDEDRDTYIDECIQYDFDERIRFHIIRIDK